jgi:anti-sigma regulatory factor (Ser/Thr protein kinase)
MRTGAAADHRGFFHETGLYSSEQELLSIVAPFLAGGADAGEPTLVAVGEANERLIKSAIGHSPKISFLSGTYSKPASVISSYRKALAAHVAEGAAQVRVVGEIPNPGLGEPWDWWARYEAAINHAYDDFPMWAICLYDTRITPADALADVMRTHPYVATADGRHLANDHFEDPVAFLNEQPPASGDALEASAPMVELIDPTPAAARWALRGAPLDAAALEDLMIAVSEAVTNAQRHSRSPVRVRAWAGHDRVVVTVTDPGPGPRDPFAGLLPASDPPGGGCGLWIVHQLCSHVTMSRDGDGFTIRLVVGSAKVPVPSQAA